jgi:hypothetical protein
LERVTTAGWAVIRGNNEYYPLDYNTDRAPAEWKTYTLIPLLLRQLGPRWLNQLAVWPDTLCLRFPDAPTLRVYHGSPRSVWEGIYDIMPDEQIAEMLAGVEESTIITGHTHLPLDRQVGRWHVLNPGSAALPLDGQLAASYMILDGSPTGWRATLRRVEYDRAPVFAAYERIGFVKQCGVSGRFVLEELRTGRIHLVAFRRWRAATCPHLSERAALDLFTEADRWAYTPAPYHINLMPPFGQNVLPYSTEC